MRIGIKIQNDVIRLLRDKLPDMLLLDVFLQVGKLLVIQSPGKIFVGHLGRRRDKRDEG
ncbi:hypothetical protein D3C78_1986940 [compost metagenome]